MLRYALAALVASAVAAGCTSTPVRLPNATPGAPLHGGHGVSAATRSSCVRCS